MMEVRRFIRLCGLALAALLFTPAAFAAGLPLDAAHAAVYAVGAEHSVERFRAELSLMAQCRDEDTAARADLRREGQGFRMVSADDRESRIALT